jgi:hypothetical protein
MMKPSEMDGFDDPTEPLDTAPAGCLRQQPSAGELPYLASHTRVGTNCGRGRCRSAASEARNAMVTLIVYGHLLQPNDGAAASSTEAAHENERRTEQLVSRGFPWPILYFQASGDLLSA